MQGSETPNQIHRQLQSTTSGADTPTSFMMVAAPTRPVMAKICFQDRSWQRYSSYRTITEKLLPTLPNQLPRGPRRVPKLRSGSEAAAQPIATRQSRLWSTTLLRLIIRQQHVTSHSHRSKEIIVPLPRRAKLVEIATGLLEIGPASVGIGPQHGPKSGQICWTSSQKMPVSGQIWAMAVGLSPDLVKAGHRTGRHSPKPGRARSVRPGLGIKAVFWELGMSSCKNTS